MGFFGYFANLPASIADSDSSLFNHKHIKPYLISNKSQEVLSSLSFLAVENTTARNFISGNFIAICFTVGHHQSNMFDDDSSGSKHVAIKLPKNKVVLTVLTYKLIIRNTTGCIILKSLKTFISRNW